MNEGRRDFLKALASAGVASWSAEAVRAENKQEQVHNVDKPFVNMSLGEFHNHIQNLSPDMQVISWPITLSTGEAGFHVITESRPPHPLPKKWREHEIGSGHYPKSETNGPKL